MTTDLDKLERLARDARGKWYRESDLFNAGVHFLDVEYIAACSPDTILTLIERVRRAEAQLAEMPTLFRIACTLSGSDEADRMAAEHIRRAQKEEGAPEADADSELQLVTAWLQRLIDEKRSTGYGAFSPSFVRELIGRLNAGEHREED